MKNYLRIQEGIKKCLEQAKIGDVVEYSFVIKEKPNTRDDFYELIYPKKNNYVCVETDGGNVDVYFTYQNSIGTIPQGIKLSMSLDASRLGTIADIKDKIITDSGICSYKLGSKISNEKVQNIIDEQAIKSSDEFSDRFSSWAFGTQATIDGTMKYEISLPNTDTGNSKEIIKTNSVPVTVIFAEECNRVVVKNSCGSNNID